MKIRILGTGNAFSILNGNNCILLEENGERLLIDAGWDLPHMLTKHNLKPSDIDMVYISHLHADHIGGLEYLALSRYDWINRPVKRNPILTNDDINKAILSKEMVLIANHDLITNLWDKSLRGGLETLEGVNANLDTYFHLYSIPPNGNFEWNGWKFTLIQQIHIMSGSIITPTFGLFAEKEGHKKIYFVTDSQHCSPNQQVLFYKKADMIIQDCEIYPFYSNVHANYEQLAGYEKANSTKLSDEVKAKMWLTHYQDFYNFKKDFYGNDCDWDEKAKIDGFAGFLRPGMEFEV